MPLAGYVTTVTYGRAFAGAYKHIYQSEGMLCTPAPSTMQAP